MRFIRRRRARLEENRRAIAKQERLAPYVELQKQEAQELGDWARDRLRQNHLTQLFNHPRGT
ncbi:hypothetical protein GCM10009795_039910 [Nocardioides hankookensis]|uniref:Uncharacterized protein n=1 Tax=Nocardioides hankookensis TaxID=443157 RepID=A0ABW1LPT8_9ACTN